MTFPVRPITFIAFLAMALGAPSAHAQKQPVDPATAQAVRRLLELTGAARLALQTMETMVPAQRQAMPQVPAAFWDAFIAHARRDIAQLVDSLVPVYAAHFTLAQLQELVRFYESPLGKRLAEVQPLIAQESMQVGQRWGAIIGAQVGDSLGRAGILKP